MAVIVVPFIVMFALGLIISPPVVLRNKRAAHSSVSVADEWVKGGKDGEVLAAVSQIVAYILIAYAAYRLGSGYFWGAIAGIGVKSFFDYLTGDLPFQKHKYLKKARDSQEIVPNHEAPTEHAMMPEDLPQEVLTQYVRRNYDGAVRTVREAGMASPGLLQGKLHISYQLSVELLDAMKREHVIGSADGARPRKILNKKN